MSEPSSSSGHGVRGAGRPFSVVARGVGHATGFRDWRRRDTRRRAHASHLVGRTTQLTVFYARPMLGRVLIIQVRGVKPGPALDTLLGRLAAMRCTARP